MIDFNEELKKYKPVLEIEELEDGVHANDVSDIMELLQHLSKVASAADKERV